MSQLATGYLPSVVLIIFMYMVPPIMLLFSTLEGSISRSGRKRSASIKVLCFLIWNVFFGNILSGSVIERFSKIFKDVTYLLATAVPSTVTFLLYAYVCVYLLSLCPNYFLNPQILNLQIFDFRNSSRFY